MINTVTKQISIKDIADIVLRRCDEIEGKKEIILQVQEDGSWELFFNQPPSRGFIGTYVVDVEITQCVSELIALSLILQVEDARNCR